MPNRSPICVLRTSISQLAKVISMGFPIPAVAAGGSGLRSPLLLVVASCGVADAGVVFVRADATGAGNGANWTDAFTRLDQALAAAVPGDQVWVAQGTYTPADAVSSFVLRSGVAVYGGFTGGETARSQRDPAAHPTILSGDIGRDDTVNPSPFAPPWPNNVLLNSPNAGHVVTAGGVDASAVLDGFRVIKGAYGPAGVPAGDPLLIGSGLYCVGGSPTVVDCAFADNFAAFGNGGAIYLYNSNAIITACSFFHNLASQGSGGAVYVGGDSGPTITECSFTSNLATASSGQTGQGGAIQLDTTRAVTIARCVFSGNIARPFGLSSYELPRGGAISVFSLTDPLTLIRECVFRNNQAASGGALFVWSPTTVLNCALDHNVAFTYDAGGGSAGGEGAGIAAQWTTVAVLNSTIANNTGRESAGMAVYDMPPNFPGLAVIRNSIVWGNVATGEDVSPRNAGIRGPRSARNSCIQDLFTVDPGEDPIDPANFPGCIAANPMLAGASAGNLRLLAGSPGIDAGGNTFIPAGTPVDLDGSARIARGLPGPGANVVDMGAFEFGSQPCAPGINAHPVDSTTCPAAPATFSVTPSGTGPFGYRWQWMAPAISPAWSDIAEGLNTEAGGGAGQPVFIATGASAATISVHLAPDTPYPHGGFAGFSVRALITNACGSTTSDPATLTVCIGDFNCDGGIDGADVEAFFAEWESGNAGADVNADGGIDGADVEFFFERWEAGC